MIFCTTEKRELDEIEEYKYQRLKEKIDAATLIFRYFRDFH